MVEKGSLDKGLIPAWTLTEQAKKRAEKFGVTDRYSTGDPMIDEYFGGGYGRDDAYEVVLIFGDTGVNKSTLATSMVLDPAKKGTKIAYFALEDEPVDVVVRMLKQCGDDYDAISKNIRFVKESFGYSLTDMIKFMGELYDMGHDIIVVDPIQFIFEASAVESGETEYNRQRVFMRMVEKLTEEKGKTAIVVSHTRKGGGGTGRNKEEGLDRVIGSNSVTQTATKVLEINRKDGVHGIRLWKNRFAKYRDVGMQVKLCDDMRIRNNYDPSDYQQLRQVWGDVTGFNNYHKGE